MSIMPQDPDSKPDSRAVQCDGYCHDQGTGDCRLCESGDYYEACDDCRFYMASDA